MSTAGTAQPVSSRIVSVDIFRGLTMLVMIFVNDLSGVKGLPWWTYHLPAEVNGMTYVDWVFPGFLFAVGMSLPLTIVRRFQRGAAGRSVWFHVIARSISLAVLGIIIANASKLDPGLAGVAPVTWMSSALAGSFLLWGVFPVSAKNRWLGKGLKITGLAMILLVLLLFRRKTPDGGSAWLDTSYWEILGLIGWSYLAVCLLYLPLRKWKWAPAILLAALCGINVLMKAGWLGFLRPLPIYIWPFGNGALPSIIVAGVVVADIFWGSGQNRTFKEKSVRSLIFAGILFVGGMVLTPFGISKIRATPTWCLYSSAISTLLFLALYWLVDYKRRTGWAFFLKPAGSNTLLTYLLPDVFYASVGFAFASEYFSRGLPGVAKSALFTSFILACSAVLTRLKFRMQL